MTELRGRIAECFYSIQGEGVTVGHPAVFIRLQGCSVGCQWCDTKYSWDPESGRDVALDDLIDEASGFSCRHAVITGGEPLKLLLHSIAFGTTTNFFGERPVTQKQMDMTVHVMGTSLLYWVQKLFDADLLGSGSRVLGLTSEGNYLCMDGYGPVSVAKVALESITRQIGWELGQHGITANCIQAGVTPTRALTKISENWEEWVEKTKKRNPMGRTTEPADVANVVRLMLQPGADFINCSIVYTDGGEHRSGTFV